MLSYLLYLGNAFPLEDDAKVRTFWLTDKKLWPVCVKNHLILDTYQSIVLAHKRNPHTHVIYATVVPGVIGNQSDAHFLLPGRPL